jgi:hypothetical protein
MVNANCICLNWSRERSWVQSNIYQLEEQITSVRTLTDVHEIADSKLNTKDLAAQNVGYEKVSVETPRQKDKTARRIPRPFTLLFNYGEW